MENLFRWASSHALTVLIVVCVLYAIGFVFAHRKSLFYKE